jgi:hypothetical protein
MTISDEEMDAVVHELEWLREQKDAQGTTANLQAELREEREKRLAARQRFIVAATVAAMGWLGFVYLGLKPVIGW